MTSLTSALTRPASGRGLPWRHWLAPLLGRRPARVARIAAISALASVLALAQPWLAKVLVDEGALAGDQRVLAISCIVMLLAPLLGLALESLTRSDYLAFSSEVLFGLREKVFAHLHTLPPTFYAKVGFGDLMARFDGDLAEIQRFVVDGPLALVNGVFNLLLLATVMSLLCAPLAAVAFAAVPLQLWLTLRSRPQLEARSREMRHEATLLSGYFLDSMRAVKHIQSTNCEAARLAGLGERHRAYFAALRDSQQAGFLLGAWQRMAGVAGSALVFGAGGWLLARGELSVGALIAFVIYAARAGAPVHTLLGVMAGWQRARVSLRRIDELLEVPPLPRPAAGVALPEPVRGEIRLDAVSFAYEAGRPVLENASLSIPAGSKLVLMGPSGGGKSTLADLLLGHLRPDAGRIEIDGVDLAGVDLASLRRHVAVVDQDPVFFPGSVADNLRAQRPGASDEELARALGEAGLAPHELNLASAVGASASALSRGQRMRLALARAILQSPAILILDETTSAIDREAEAGLLAAIDRHFAGRTRLIIAHHGAAPAQAECVYLLRDGHFEPLTRAGNGHEH